MMIPNPGENLGGKTNEHTQKTAGHGVWPTHNKPATSVKSRKNQRQICRCGAGPEVVSV
jgi:hypothetical protein